MTTRFAGLKSIQKAMVNALSQSKQHQHLFAEVRVVGDRTEDRQEDDLQDHGKRDRIGQVKGWSDWDAKEVNQAAGIGSPIWPAR